MSDLNYRQKSSKASKYAATIQNDFRGENRALVDLLIKEAFIAGLDAQTQANGVEKSDSNCNLQNVVRSLLFDRPSATGWYFDSDFLRKTTRAANRHDPMITMEDVEYVLRALAEK